MLRIHSIFRSIQGEGQLIGVPMAFVRVAGCPLRCSWCDTEDARSAQGDKMSVDQVIEEIEKTRLRYVCLTGGEPLAQNESITLMNGLLNRGYFVQLETSGALDVEEVPCSEKVLISMDIKCPSSGMDDRMMFSNIELLSPFDQLKFIIADEADFKHAKQIIEKYEPKCPIIMTPVGGLDLEFLAKRVLKSRMNARVLPQLHKMIWGNAPDR